MRITQKNKTRRSLLIKISTIRTNMAEAKSCLQPIIMQYCYCFESIIMQYRYTKSIIVHRYIKYSITILDAQ